jgi:hypothetical protein
MRRLGFMALAVALTCGASAATAQVDSLSDSVQADRRDKVSRILPELRTKPGSALFIDIVLTDMQLTRVLAIIHALQSRQATVEFGLENHARLSPAVRNARLAAREEAYRLMYREILTPKQQALFDRNVIWAETAYRERHEGLVTKKKTTRAGSK